MVEKRDAIHISFECGEIVGGSALGEGFNGAERRNEVVAARAEDEFVVDSTEHRRLSVVKRAVLGSDQGFS